MWANRPPIQRTATLPSPIRASGQEAGAMSSLPVPLTFSFAPISRGSSGSSSPSASPREMLSFATTAPSSCDSSLDTLTCANSTIPLEEMVRTLKWDAEPPHAASPDASMDPSQPQLHSTQPSSPVLEAVDDPTHHSVDSILNPLSPVHRKVASCPFGFDLYQPSTQGSSAPTTPTLETRNVTHAPSHSHGKLLHSSSNHSHLYHPYARDSPSQHQPHHHQSSSNSLSSPPSQGLNSNNSAIHRPTVISPASRFLSRKLGPNIPAALAAHSLHNSLPPSASASSNLHAAFPPPLSLNILSSQPEFGSVTQPSHIQPTHSPSQSDGTSSVFVQPASPTLNAALLAAAAASSNQNSNSSFRTPTGSPSHTSVRNLQMNETTQQQQSPNLSHPPLHRSPQNHVRHHSYSPTSSASGSPLIKPDFSAFDSPAEGWGRLSAHSPAKHRSLPGTPLHRPHSSYTVPPTPNAKLSKSARNSRRPSTERVLLDTSAMLIDYSMLHLPATSVPILSPLPTNPSFLEMIVSTEELGVGSYGEVCKVELNSSQPFAQTPLHLHQIHLQSLSSGSSSVGNSAPASPFFQSHQLPLPSSTTSTSTASSVASTEAAPSPSSSSPPLYEFAYKKTRAPFATIQERQRMLMKYIHLFEFVHKLRGLCVERQTLLSQGLPVQTFNGIDLLSFVDQQTFFPQHMVFHSHLWQENAKFHCLMELCERGDLTTYWYQPTVEELRLMEREREEELRSYPYDPHYDDDSEDNNNVAMSDAAASNDEVQRAPVSALSETVMWRLLMEMSSVLALMHACNFYHCDIKPQQIFVTEDERFKLGDVDSCVMLHDRSAHVQQHTSAHLSVPSASPGASNAPNSTVGSPSSSPTPLSRGFGSGNSSGGTVSTDTMMNMELLEQLEEGDGLWSAPELLHTMHNLTDKCDVYSLGASVYAILNDEILQKDEMGNIHLTFAHLKCPISSTMKTTLQEMTNIIPEQRPTAIYVLQLAQKMLHSPLPASELKIDWSK